MTETPKGKGPGSSRSGQGAGNARDDRLKAALKANLARRKAQARARADGADENGQEMSGNEEG
ncbi:hypothetical protein [Chachezhania antarctica]|uniref:hypothetical protein n=1 Tax=Chachezhania antarctica TaxID=2340860 RepID=UPI000EAFE0BC|nr:hypothetical protein [Chachezhania antarctica]|tara:strand:- start:4018 stop:4206 length:189 start_codon:yes stop_codon:yes gene_type:complete